MGVPERRRLFHSPACAAAAVVAAVAAPTPAPAPAPATIRYLDAKPAAVENVLPVTLLVLMVVVEEVVSMSGTRSSSARSCAEAETPVTAVALPSTLWPARLLRPPTPPMPLSPMVMLLPRLLQPPPPLAVLRLTGASSEWQSPSADSPPWSPPSPLSLSALELSVSDSYGSTSRRTKPPADRETLQWAEGSTAGRGKRSSLYEPEARSCGILSPC
ncbi:Obscurin [Frankliniella fusca]|uniref:Obscurin n=1 Tax=Frankliniella fusca TaxID=407009 RepID=A0AAE1H552_9NEOP|nr:Obscurin [Frankliniella fusca]